MKKPTIKHIGGRIDFKTYRALKKIVKRDKLKSLSGLFLKMIQEYLRSDSINQDVKRITGK